MNIHEEKTNVNIRDTRLLLWLFSFAKPYWRMILLCLSLAVLIVVADLARPYLIKLAIDDHIKGYEQPMIAVSADRKDELKPLGKPFVVEGNAYVRVQAGGAAEAKLARVSGAFRAQIVEVGDGRYLIDGWIVNPKQEPVLENGGSAVSVRADHATYAAAPLDKEQTNAFRHKDLNGLLQLGLLFLLAVAGGSVLNYIQGNLLQYTGQHIIFNIREKMFTHLSKMSMSFFDRNPVGRIVVRVTQDTEALNQLYSQVVVNLIKDIIVMIGIVVIMLQLSVKLSLLAFVVLPGLALLTFWYRNSVREAQRKARLILSRLNAFLAENLSGIRITQLFIREQRQWEQFDDHNQQYYRAGMRSTTINSIFQPAIGFVGNLAIALLVWYGGVKVLDGAITFGIVYAFTQYIRQFFQPLQSIAEKYNQIQTAMVGAERIYEMLSEKPAIVDAPEPLRLTDHVKGRIRFEHVWFAYNEGEWVLRDVSFTIEPGQTVAFVGATGAGKSSIIQLINRFYDIQKGSITLDGIDIRLLPLDELRRTVSVVQQDVFLFTGDIASNIRLQNDAIGDDQVAEAVRMVHMEPFVGKLPLGLHTPLGERGVTLSLGQRQLLSFARAIVFRPKILILDEATSNIDTETELIVQDALQTISQGRTTLIVAHRLSTIQHADQIIVMHKGKVRETGSHFELLALRGYYHRLFELQYKDMKRIKPAESM